MKKKSISFIKRCISVLLAVPIASLGLVTAFAENGTSEQSDVTTRDTYVIAGAGRQTDLLTAALVYSARSSPTRPQRYATSPTREPLPI